MSEINVSVGGGPGVVVSVAGDGTTATVTTGGTVNVTLTESNPTWSGIAGKPSTFPPQAHSHFIADTVGLQAALNEKADLDAGGKVPASQLPSYVDDVLEFANLAALPATGETGKIYVTTGNGKIYRWSGTTYIEISAAPGSTDFVPEGTGNLYHTTARAAAAAPVQSATRLWPRLRLRMPQARRTPPRRLRCSGRTIRGRRRSRRWTGSRRPSTARLRLRIRTRSRTLLGCNRR